MNGFEPEKQEEKFDADGLKLTIQKFYRINGASNQLEGVKSDIVLPDSQMFLSSGERTFPNPLANDNIKVANYTPWKTDYSSTIVKSQKRIANSKTFKAIRENAKWQKQKKDRKQILLSVKDFQKHSQKDEQQQEKISKLLEKPTGILFSPMPQEAEAMRTNEDLKIRRTRWFESLQKDVYVEEPVKVLADMQ